LAEDFLNQAKLRLITAKAVFEKEAYAYCILQSQEAVELALKSALRLLGVDYPKWHDVGIVLKEIEDKFPDEFKSEIPNLVEISEKLNALREPAMYGDESQKKGPSALFTKSDAKEIIKETEFSLQKITDLFNLFEKKK